ncbi:MAG: peptidoglycan DD-metalloendopeptidase family protein [Alistipes sp.]
MFRKITCTLLATLLTTVVATAQDETHGESYSPEDEEGQIDDQAVDSVAQFKQFKQNFIESTFCTEGLIVIDTLATANEAIQVVLYSDNTWKYIRNREIAKDTTIFEKYWDNKTLFPYRNADLSTMPSSVVIELLDTLENYHYPCMGKIRDNGKFGMRRRHHHQGVDLPLHMGDPIYATFSGRVRISEYNHGGYGNLIILRHDNGLETYYGHLSERLVECNQWIEAGQVIGLGGSTGRSTGPHLHFETRYYGQSFDPERLIDFQKGLLCRETFLLKKNFFNINSKAGEDFDDEVASAEQEKKEIVKQQAAKKAAIQSAKKFHKVRSGDTLSHLATKYHTSVKKICSLNRIKPTTLLQLGRSLRVR